MEESLNQDGGGLNSSALCSPVQRVERVARRARNLNFDEEVGGQVAISQRPRFQLKGLVALSLSRKGLLLMDQKPLAWMNAAVIGLGNRT